MYDSSDRITFLSFVSLSTDMVISELATLINGLEWHTPTPNKGKALFIGKVIDSNKMNHKRFINLKSNNNNSSNTETVMTALFVSKFRKQEFSELWLFPRLLGFLEKVGLLIPRLRFFF